MAYKPWEVARSKYVGSNRSSVLNVFASISYTNAKKWRLPSLGIEISPGYTITQDTRAALNDALKSITSFQNYAAAVYEGLLKNLFADAVTTAPFWGYTIQNGTFTKSSSSYRRVHQFWKTAYKPSKEAKQMLSDLTKEIKLGSQASLEEYKEAQAANMRAKAERQRKANTFYTRLYKRPRPANEGPHLQESAQLLRGSKVIGRVSEVLGSARKEPLKASDLVFSEYAPPGSKTEIRWHIVFQRFNKNTGVNVAAVLHETPNYYGYKWLEKAYQRADLINTFRRVLNEDLFSEGGSSKKYFGDKFNTKKAFNEALIKFGGLPASPTPRAMQANLKTHNEALAIAKATDIARKNITRGIKPLGRP